MIIDWQHHYLQEELWLEKGGKSGERVVIYENGIPRVTLQPELYQIDKHLEAMDNAGIDVAVLSKVFIANDTAVALEECKSWDDSVSDIMREYPGRFVGLAPIPPLGGESAFAELDRAVDVLGFKGVMISSQVNGLTLDSEQLWPFYEKVQSLDIPIFVHVTGKPSGYDIMNAPYDLNRGIGREFDLLMATTRLIMGGVLEDFPDLNFVISHMGGGISAIMERIEQYLDFPDATGSRIDKPFRHYFDKLYFDSAGYRVGTNAVKYALITIKPSQLLFGTDYPQAFAEDPESIKDSIENIRKLEISEELKQQILGGNARNLLKL
ncbi:amidohydrolase family protein [Thermodesulfobacteriota bacterium]